MHGKMNYMLVLAIVFASLSLTQGAPQMRRHRRHKMNEEPNYPHYPHKLMWNQTCGKEVPSNRSNPLINNMRRNRVEKPLLPLREAMRGFLTRLDVPGMQAIDTSDVSQWFSEPFNSTYGFLTQINGSSSNIYLRKRHEETQVYVGAFQYLLWKQKNHDRIWNEGIGKSIELDLLLVLAKNVLCEIESAICRTGLKRPAILTREKMEQRLTFRNNNQDRKNSFEIDDIDSKFAKVRFSEYLHGLQKVLKNRKHRQPQKLIPIHPVNDGSLQRNDAPAVPNKIDQTLFDKVLRDNDIGTKKHHKKNGQKKQRSRMGLNKQRKHRKNLRRLNPNANPNQLGQFRQHRRRNNLLKSTTPSSVASVNA